MHLLRDLGITKDIGDDCIRFDKNVVIADQMIENVHFKKE